jgi:hypothetical protein
MQRADKHDARITSLFMNVQQRTHKNETFSVFA